jgi:hypothetical protein
MSGYYRYCRLTRLAEAVALGWRDCGLLPGHHGAWSHLVFWPGDGCGPWFGGEP